MVGSQSIIAFVVFGRFSQPLGNALGLAGLVLAGGMAEVLFVSVVRWPPPLRGQRAAVSSAYRELAAFARAPLMASGIPAAGALDDAQATLASPTLFGDVAVLRLRTLVDEGRRVRLELNAIRILLRQISRARGGPEAQAKALLGRAGAALRQAAAGVNGDRHAAAQFALQSQALSGEAARLDASFASGGGDRGSPAGLMREHLAERFAALAGQLRVVAAVLPHAGSSGRMVQRRPRAGANPVGDALRSDLAQIRANVSLQSPAGRHALRLAVVVFLCELLARGLPLQRSYWMVVAAATVLRPEFGATFTRGVERTIATIGGVAIAGVVSLTLNPAHGGTVVLVWLLAWAAYALLPASLAVGYAFITTLIVFLLDVVSPDTLATATDRLLDTIVGASIGLAAYALWPTWSAPTARQGLADLVDAQRAYLDAVLARLVDGGRVDEAAMRPLARRARLVRTNADSAVARSLREPATQRIDADQSQAILAGLRRLVEATHVLRIDAQHDHARRALPGLAPFAQLVAGVLDAISSAMHAEGDEAHAQGPAMAALRERYERFAGSAEGAATGGVLLVELDEVVDVVDSVAALVGVAGTIP